MIVNIFALIGKWPATGLFGGSTWAPFEPRGGTPTMGRLETRLITLLVSGKIACTKTESCAMCMCIKSKKDHEDGTKQAPELLASLYAQMKEYVFDGDIQDPTNFGLKMCELLCQPSNPKISKLRKDLSHYGYVEATRGEFMEAAQAGQLRKYLVIGKAEETQDDSKRILYLASSDLGNAFYDSWCTRCLCFDSPLNGEHTADLVEALLALNWLQVRAPGMEHPYGLFKDLHTGLVSSLRQFRMPDLAQQIGTLLQGTSLVQPSSGSAGSAGPSAWATASSGDFPPAPPPPYALSPEGKKLERIATATANVAACMKQTSKAVKKLAMLVDTPADQMMSLLLPDPSDTEAEEVGTKRKAADGGQGTEDERKTKAAKSLYTLAIAFDFCKDVLEGDDKDAALKDLKDLVEDPTSVPMTLPQGVQLSEASPQGIIDYLHTLPVVDPAHHATIKAKSLALLRHSNPSILPMSNFWASLQHVHAHLARAVTWDFPEKYLPGPWHLFKELACAWDGKGYVFQFLVLNCGCDDMRVLVRADPYGRVAHTITTSGMKLAAKPGSKGAAKGSQGGPGSTWNARTYSPQSWGDSWSSEKWDW
jgi:hypothetical protein